MHDTDSDNTTSQQYNASIWDIVDGVEQMLSGMLAGRLPPSVSICNLSEFGDGWYNTIVRHIVHQITSLPADRLEHGLDPKSDAVELAEGYRYLIGVVGSTFGLTVTEIEQDMKQYANQFTAVDVFTARQLRKANKLN